MTLFTPTLRFSSVAVGLTVALLLLTLSHQLSALVQLSALEAGVQLLDSFPTAAAAGSGTAGGAGAGAGGSSGALQSPFAVANARAAAAGRHRCVSVF